MADSYWKYAAVDNRQQQQQQQQQQHQHQPQLQQHQQQQQLHSLIGKRPRTDYDLPGGREMPSYFGREEERGNHLVVKDSDTIGASYDRYLRGTQVSPYAGLEAGRPMSTGVGGHILEDPRLMSLGLMGVDPALALAAKGRDAGLMGARPEIALPPDASNTLYVEGLPSNCSRREVAHIFRPFVGYKEVRLVTKESRHSSGDPLVLCFVDFESPAEAATAKDALQGYKFDEHDRDSATLRMQFARNPGARTGGSGRSGGAARSGGGSRGRR